MIIFSFINCFFDVLNLYSRIPTQMFQLSNIMSDDINSIHQLLRLFHDEQQGLLFIKDSVLPDYSFIAIEAIWWSIKHCDDIQNEQTALNLFQVILTKKSFCFSSLHILKDNQFFILVLV